MIGFCFLAQYAFAAFCAIHIYNVNNIPPALTLAGSLGIVWLLNMGTFLLAVQLDPERRDFYRLCLWSAFAYYGIIAFYALFRWPLWQRFDDLMPMRASIHNSWALAQGRLGWQYVAREMAFHLLAYAPLGFFLPRLLPPMRNPRLFLLFMLLLLAAASLAMKIFDCGTPVFDYLALSLLGGLAAYRLTWQIPAQRGMIFY